MYNRLEFTISKDDKWQEAQKAEKVATMMQAINSILDGQLQGIGHSSVYNMSVTGGWGQFCVTVL